MNKYIQLNDVQKQGLIDQVSLHCHLNSQAVEKDWWVSQVLQAVFMLPFADKLVFKGGTSLSKAWKVIERFSEDVDLAIDRSAFGLEGDLTKKQLKKLRKESSVFVQTTVTDMLREKLEELGLGGLCEVVADPNGEGDNTYPEPRIVRIKYKSLFATLPYLPTEIRLEIGARSLFEPTSQCEITSYIAQSFPQYTDVAPFPITTAVPQKTFLEKVFLLHELFSTNTQVPAKRRSRHIYDLSQMMKTDIVHTAIADKELWETIRHHREVFTPLKDVDYTADIRNNLCLIPPMDSIEDWRADYAEMSIMMYGLNKPAFDELLEDMRRLMEMFKD